MDRKQSPLSHHDRSFLVISKTGPGQEHFQQQHVPSEETSSGSSQMGMGFMPFLFPLSPLHL